MCKIKIVIFTFLLTTLTTYAQLSEGDLMFVGYNADGDNGFSVVPLVDIPANTTIYFTDNEWNGFAIGSGGAFKDVNEHELTWTTGILPILAGVVVNMIDTDNILNPNYGASIGTITGTMDPNASNEVLYAFIGNNDSTPTTFLSAITNSSFSNTNGTLTNTGLIDGTNALAITGNDDVLVYDGPVVCDGAILGCALEIADASNWISEDGTGDQSRNSIAPDFPDDVPIFFSVVLPIELISFEVKEFGPDKAELSWITATEINNSFFTIERSSNALVWDELSNIEGAGNSTAILNYSFLDSDPLYGAGYYRLKQTDFNGEFEYSEIISHVNKSDIELTLYPNPTYESLTVQGKNLNQANIEIVNNLGIIVNPRITNRSENKVQFNLNALSSGIYIIRVDLNNRVESSFFHKE